MAKSNNNGSNKSRSNMSRNQKMGVGIGLAAAAAAAAAGAYFLYGKNGARNRRKVKGWMLKARGEVMERMEALEQVSQDTYHQIVDSVLRGYRTAKNASPAELAAVAAELKAHWNSINRSFKSARRSSSKRSSSSAGSNANKRGGSRKKGASSSSGSKKNSNNGR